MPGELNPADLGTRRGRLDEIITERWWLGPEYLLKKEDSWPRDPEMSKVILEGCFQEAKLSTILLAYTASENVNASLNFEKVLDLERFRSFHKLCIVTA